MPRTLTVDVAVIGAGSAGLGARRTAEKHGASTVLIESGPYGTTCARVGCMPSKLLIAAADAAHDMRHAGAFGVHGEPRIDEAAVFERVRRERDRFAGFVVDATEQIPEERRLRGRARFIGPTALMVGDHTRVEAKAVVVATGSRPWLPPPLRPVADRLLDNESVFELSAVPRRLAVVGTGVIGLELGQALARLGAKVTFFSVDDRLGPLTDPHLQHEARKVLGAALDLRLGTPIDRAEPEGDGLRLTWTTADGDQTSEVFTHVLAATGRKPNLDLDLGAAGLPADERGVPRFDPNTMQCSRSGVFLAGDVTNDRVLLHEASDEGRIAGRNAARYAAEGHAGVRRHERRTPLTVVFSHPQMALVGQTFAELEAGDAPYEVGEVDYGDQGRARVMGVNAGRVRIYGSPADGALLGAELFAPGAEHTAHLLAWAIQSRMRVDESLRMPFYHPVLEEGIRTALRDLSAKMRMSDPIELRCIDCGPGS